MKPLGLCLKDIAGDGNCLFRSLSDQYYGNPKYHAKIRSRICEFLEVNRDHFQYFVEDDGDFDEYLGHMKELGTYGGNMELVAFARSHDVNIRVYQPGTVFVIEGGDGVDNKGKAEERRTLHIAYHSWEHYDSVRNIDGPHTGDPEIKIIVSSMAM